MKRVMWKPRRAMTLIEIVAGLVILGTILASLAIARGRFMRQWAAADRKLVAGKALDGLIADWMRVPLVPLNRQGALGDGKHFIWRTHTVRSPDAILSAAVVRVEVFDREEKLSAPILSVDLMVHSVPKQRAGEGR